MIKIICLASVVFLWNCSSKNKLTHEETCNQKFDKLNEKFQKGRYSVIREPLSDFLSTCNGTPFTEKAQLQLAEAHFHLKEWIEASVEFKNFIQIYPSSSEVELAHYRLALSLAEQTYSIDRDQNNTFRALDEFENYVKLYSESPRADSAKQKISELKGILGKKQIKIGKLYLKLSEPQAAAIYFKTALDKYGKHIDKNELQILLVDCYLRLNQIAEAEKHLLEIDQLKSSNPHYSKMKHFKKKLDEKKNLQPKNQKPEKKS